MSSVGKTVTKVAKKAMSWFAPEMPDMPAATEQQVIQVPAPAAEEATRYKRMPTPTDPEVLAAGRRTRAEALRRKGRLSTILTDQTAGGGYGGRGKLGA